MNEVNGHEIMERNNKEKRNEGHERKMEGREMTILYLLPLLATLHGS